MTLDLLDEIENYRRFFTDVNFWQPYVAAAMNQVQLPCQIVHGGIPGTCPTFIVDNTYVIKFFGRLFNGEVSFDTELNANRMVKEQGNIPIPALVAQGKLLEDGFDWSWPYLVFEYLDGISIGEAWGEISTKERQEVAKEMGLIMRSLHSIPLKDGGYFRPEWDVFRSFLEIQRSRLLDRRINNEGLPIHLRNQLEGFLLPINQLIEPDKKPYLVHADLTRDHLLGKVEVGKWDTLGLIDFGDAIVGNIFYELIALHLDLFQGDKQLLGIFLKFYGLEKSLKSNLSKQAMNMTLLHQFSQNILVDLFHRRPQLKQTRTLDELADEIWGKGY
jgi:hygromycin-B 7''-O-kinase